MQQPYDERKNQIDLIHQAEDPKGYQSCHPSDSHKMINQEEGSPEEEDSLEEDSPEEDSLEEDSPEEEDSLEEEDSPEEEDTQEEAEYHPEGHLEEVGDCHHCLCHRPNKGSW